MVYVLPVLHRRVTTRTVLICRILIHFSISLFHTESGHIVNKRVMYLNCPYHQFNKLDRQKRNLLQLFFFSFDLHRTYAVHQKSNQYDMGDLRAKFGAFGRIWTKISLTPLTKTSILIHKEKRHSWQDSRSK